MGQNRRWESGRRTAQRPGRIRFKGLRSYLNRTLDRLSAADTELEIRSVYESICKTSRHIEQQIETDSLKDADLTPETREIRGWLAFFARLENFQLYLEALTSCRLIFADFTLRPSDKSLKIIFHFRPLSCAYRLKQCHHLVYLEFATPMIIFGNEDFALLAALIRGDKQRRPEVDELLLADDYQEVQTEQERLFPQFVQAKTCLQYLAAGKAIPANLPAQPEPRSASIPRLIPSQPLPRPIPSPVAPLATFPQVGRNAPCRCGSGRKYKKCCGQ